MHFALTLIAALFQATPLPSPTAPPPPPVLVSPAPSPSASPAALSAQPAALNLHPSQTATVTAAGVTGTLAATVDPALVTLAVDQAAKTITVSAGQQTGRATLTISDGSGTNLQVPVRVAYDAGAVPQALTLRITGDSVDPQWLQTQIQKAVVQNAQLQPGAVASLGAFAAPPQLEPGASAVVPVPVQISGGDAYFDVSALSTISLQNVPVTPWEPSTLFYDDDPEKIVTDGVLYRNEVVPSTPVRLYYYHENSADARRLLVVLSAASTDPSSVQLLDASAGPNIDVMSVGHAVSRDFLSAKPHNQGLIADVTPSAPYIADEFALQRLDGAAGSIGLRVLGGGPVRVTVLAVPSAVSDAQIAQYLAQPQLPDDGHHRTGSFSLNGYADDRLAYTVGGQDAETQYGATTPPPLDGAGHDYGDYGVIRTLTFDVSNPTSAPATLYLFEQPLGGVVRSSFLVNGTLVQVGCARVSQRYQIGEPVAVNPGSSQIVVQTMTDGGSNYPLGVGLTATPPLAQTPAIAAADGCFPKPQSASP